MRFSRCRRRGSSRFARFLCIRGATENVPAAAPCLEKRRAARVAEFTPQTVYVDFDEIREGIERFVPDVFGNFRAADDPAGVARQKLEERIFLRGERDGAVAALGGLRGGVEDQVSYNNLRGKQFVRAAQKSSEAREEFAKLKGLCQVVVGTGIEAGNAVFDGIASRQHEDGHALSERANGTTGRETVAAGNHYVEDDQVIVINFDLIDGVVSVGHNIDGVGLLLETFGDKTGDTRVVFDQQKSHGRIIRQFARRIAGGRKRPRGSVGNSQSALTGLDKGAVMVTKSGLDQTALPSLNSSLFIETATWLWFTRMSK